MPTFLMPSFILSTSSTLPTRLLFRPCCVFGCTVLLAAFILSTTTQGQDLENQTEPIPIADRSVQTVIRFVSDTLVKEADHIESRLRDRVAINLLFGNTNLLDPNAKSESNKERQVGIANPDEQADLETKTQSKSVLDLPIYEQNHFRKHVQIIATTSQDILKSELVSHASALHQKKANEATKLLSQLIKNMDTGLVNLATGEVSKIDNAPPNTPAAVCDQMQLTMRQTAEALEKILEELK